MDVTNLSINNQNKLLEKYSPKGKASRRIISEGRSSVEISDFSRELQSSKVDFANSKFAFQNDTLNFDVFFLKSVREEFNLNGYLSSTSQRSQVDLKYRFEQTVFEKGQPFNRTFEATLQISFGKENAFKITKSAEKEDILDFIRRLTKEIVEILNDKNKNLVAVVLSKEDIKDLTSIGDQKVIDLVNSLINTIVSSARMKSLLNNSSNSEKVIYQPNRRVDEVTTTENNFSSYVDYRFEIKEIQSK
ncbi:MAG: hypothetical protein V1720_18755 [bacterium]